MAISAAKSARAAGALLFNYAEATDLIFDGKRWNILVSDGVLGAEYEVKAKTLVNATGPFADNIRRKVSNAQPRIKPSKGIHIFTDKFQVRSGFLIPQTGDGRVIFCLPWEGKTMIGTTDDFCETMDNRVENPEIDYLLGEVNRYLQEPLSEKDVTGTMVGYRPLVLKSSVGMRSEALIRDHEVEVVREKNAVHVLGGKWTTFRLMAEDAVNRLFPLLNKPFVKTQTTGRSFSDSIEPETYFRFVSRYGFLSEETQKHLLRYGRDFEKVLDFARRDGYAPLSEGLPYLSGEYAYARQFEWVENESDFFLRRLSVGLTDGLRRAAAIPAG
jgi:glycerol-3-phosphate dehydrogenase